jgi:hypothetical protein
VPLHGGRGFDSHLLRVDDRWYSVGMNEMRTHQVKVGVSRAPIVRWWTYRVENPDIKWRESGPERFWLRGVALSRSGALKKGAIRYHRALGKKEAKVRAHQDKYRSEDVWVEVSDFRFDANDHDRVLFWRAAFGAVAAILTLVVLSLVFGWFFAWLFTFS